MNKFFVGHSPLTTMAGYSIAVLTALTQASANGAHRWSDYLLPAAIALFGRLAGDDHHSGTVPPPETTAQDNVPSAGSPKYGSESRRLRNSKGQFAAG